MTHANQNDKTLIVDDREGGLFRVHRSVFVEDEILEQERRQIFDKSWLYVGHESEIPKPHDSSRARWAGAS